jgi:hypothetical protein
MAEPSVCEAGADPTGVGVDDLTQQELGTDRDELNRKAHGESLGELARSPG